MTTEQICFIRQMYRGFRKIFDYEEGYARDTIRNLFPETVKYQIEGYTTKGEAIYSELFVCFDFHQRSNHGSS